MLCWPEDSLPERIAFISDLHLFSTRTTADEHITAMREAAETADLVVFGGDLFDFRWSRLADAERTAAAAIDWLADFADSARGRQFVYLFGNHDGDPLLRRRLAEWQDSRSDFEIAGDLLRVGDTAFLHGDVIEGKNDGRDLDAYRLRWADKPRASDVQSRVYDAAVTVRAHRLAAALAHRRRRTQLRLIRYLSHQLCGPAEGIRRVVFGHTHRLCDGQWYRGTQFFNPGAAVRGVPFRPIVIPVGDSTPES
ncbi:metallophosphoesterase [Candidatus Laterigemmans baculatus]|uniref:metallophosphoesterase n=1 Tax=Candidatus Laterigemmans baculatus TaxID=2770505 RepID=UPI0013DABFFE|nr:metallophosphoesterase [Candidatus Laterigemmans baculatus]